MKKVWIWLQSVGPGIFCIGYTIGTGSVTSMVKAGSEFGMQLLWVLVLSCLFSWVLMEAYGRYAVVTGNTAIISFRSRLKGGKPIAILVVVGIIVAQWSSLTGILGLSAHAIYEVSRLFFPSLPESNYWAVVAIAVIIIGIMYGLLFVGKYSLFENILIVFVTIMGLSFILATLMVFPDPGDIASGMMPTIPAVDSGKLLVAAFVGTTMAAPTFVVRPLLLKEKGWGPGQRKAQSKDALFSAVLMLIINLSIMAAAAGALHSEGKIVNKVLDMVYALEPIAGRMAVALFFVGTLAAGLSSIFPILMVAPLLIADYRSGKMDAGSGTFKTLTAIACLVGLTIPVLGTNPILAQIATQVAAVFILPVVIGGIYFLINNTSLMGRHKAGFWLNLGIIMAFIFSILISYTGIIALTKLL